MLCLQEVIEIMKEALFDSFNDGYGCVDFRRSGRGGKGKQVSWGYQLTAVLLRSHISA